MDPIEISLTNYQIYQILNQVTKKTLQCVDISCTSHSLSISQSLLDISGCNGKLFIKETVDKHSTGSKLYT